MHSRITRIIRTGAALALVFGLSTVAFGQGPQLRIDNLSALEGRAVNVVDVTLDEKLLGMVAGLVGKHKAGDDAEAKRVKEFITGLKGIYVRSYEFETENAYSQSDVESLRAQLKAPGWARIVNVRHKKNGDNAEVYLLTQNGQMAGLAIIAAEPKELTVVNIVGNFDLERLSDLDGNFGIPGVRLDSDKKTTGN